MRASDRAYRTLRDEIVDWKLPPGSVLGEVEQSTRLGVSRTPLREALARLTADGLVAPQAGRGLVVTDISLENIRELFEVRQALESQAARIAATRHEGDAFERLEAEFLGIAELLERDDPERHAYYDLVRQFDDAIDDAVHNPYLVTALESMRTHLVRVRRLAKDNPERAQLLSKLRAMAVRRELVKNGVILREIRGYGAQMPVATNTEDEGRLKNRRVEVWVY